MLEMAATLPIESNEKAALSCTLIFPFHQSDERDSKRARTRKHPLRNWIVRVCVCVFLLQCYYYSNFSIGVETMNFLSILRFRFCWTKISYRKRIVCEFIYSSCVERCGQRDSNRVLITASCLLMLVAMASNKFYRPLKQIIFHIYLLFCGNYVIFFHFA